ncbi:MAG: hypothetical protein K5694_01580 [Bacilli bacterium]|nr:hypothetical protein [Bacilli bacterium]
MYLYLIFFLISLINGFLCYLITSSYVIGIAAMIIYLLATLFLVVPTVKRHMVRVKKRHECFRFVNTFIVSLSVSQSGQEAYESALTGGSDELSKTADSITNLTIDERLQYLERFFLVDYYRMFYTIYQLYLTQGGDVLTLAEPLLKETTLFETHENSLEKVRVRYLTQFAVLWVLTILVLIFVRVGLNNYYTQLVQSSLYIVLAVLYFVIELISIVIFAYRVSGEKFSLKLGGSKDA